MVRVCYGTEEKIERILRDSCEKQENKNYLLFQPFGAGKLPVFVIILFVYAYHQECCDYLELTEKSLMKEKKNSSSGSMMNFISLVLNWNLECKECHSLK